MIGNDENLCQANAEQAEMPQRSDVAFQSGDEFEAKAREIAGLIYATAPLLKSSAVSAIASALREAKAEENEACAKIADGVASQQKWIASGREGHYPYEHHAAYMIGEIVKVIRARTEPQEAPKASDPTM